MASERDFQNLERQARGNLFHCHSSLTPRLFSLATLLYSLLHTHTDFQCNEMLVTLSWPLLPIILVS